MLRRSFTRMGLVLAALVLAVSPAMAQPGPKIHRIVAVGDLHGDYAAWRDIARAAGVIDDKGHWTGGKAVLVQTGDVVDRGPDSLKIVLDLMRLQKEAPKAGGRVIALVGNHEAMNVTDDLRYVSQGDYAAFVDGNSQQLRERVYAANRPTLEAAYRKRDPTLTSEAIKQAWMAATPLGMLEHQAAWHGDGKIGLWVISNPAVVALDGTLFVHGGLSGAYAATPLDEINRRVAAALKAGDTDPASIINDPMGPLWYRGLIARDKPAAPAAPGATGASAETPPADPAAPPAPPGPSIEEELGQVLQAYGAKRMVIGHTPILSGIAVLFDGRLIRIDTGISAYYGGALTYLEILDGVAIPHTVQRSAPVKAGAQ
ncbi:MAG: hypothetical protein JWP35_3231 [Caulobacter sp.]|nr:hypothetical protein [Caulobacter sp.]